MELIDLIPVFNLYEEFWKIYTKSDDTIAPQYISDNSNIERAIIGEGTSNYGEIRSSVIGSGVVIGEGSVVKDSIVMKNVKIGKNVKIEKAIIAEDAVISDDVILGVGEAVPNDTFPKIYTDGIVTIGENSFIPAGVSIGKNTAISGVTTAKDYDNGVLASGRTLIKAGDSQ
jgi:glucose-1-phosphate adenylyltransferase